MDLTIEGKAYINGSFETCCIGVQEGKIALIKKNIKGDEHLQVLHIRRIFQQAQKPLLSEESLAFLICQIQNLKQPMCKRF